MFDTVICDMPLPAYPEGYKVQSFQSKSTPCQGMARYKITVDGHLLLERIVSEWKECSDSPTGFIENELGKEWVFQSDYSGSFEFYDYRRHFKYDYGHGYNNQYEAGLFLYKAIVDNGKVLKIIPIEIKLPRKLSQEEIDDREEARIKAWEENKKRMAELRKKHPSKTQKMIDTIDNLIHNKPAIFDGSDLISILNNISSTIAEWRKDNDPWYESDQNTSTQK
jgi:hypothetical protein